jgi:hypothetical protein
MNPSEIQPATFRHTVRQPTAPPKSSDNTWSDNEFREQAELKKTLQKFVKLCVKIVG